MSTDWPAVLIFASIGGVYVLLWRDLTASAGRDWQTLLEAQAHDRRTVLSAQTRRSDPVGPEMTEDPQLLSLAPPSTPADVVERQAATPAGFQQASLP